MKVEKVLQFASEMEKVCEEKIRSDHNEFKEERRDYYFVFYPEYKLVLDMIKECKNEIALEEVKNNGGKASIEKKRTSAAKNVLKELLKKSDAYASMTGYKTLEDGKIVITNSYLLYIGTPIIGIEESPKPDCFPNIYQVIPDYEEGRNLFDLDIADVKTRFKCAKAEWKGKLKKGERLYCKTKDGCLIITNRDGQEVYFNSELIIQCCDMIGGENYTIQVDGEFKPAIIRCKENDNYCIVLPFRKLI